MAYSLLSAQFGSLPTLAGLGLSVFSCMGHDNTYLAKAVDQHFAT